MIVRNTNSPAYRFTNQPTEEPLEGMKMKRSEERVQLPTKPSPNWKVEIKMQEYVGQKVWTESEDDQLKEMWGQGLSASTIAEALGKTKNSVIGRRSRLGITQRKSPIKPKVQPPKVTRMRDLENGDCRWPDGTEIYDFCGKPVKKGSAYCESHHNRAYKKIDKKPRGV